MYEKKMRVLLLALSMWATATLAFGFQKALTFVSSKGDDLHFSGGCPVDAPCRTLATALVQTQAGGAVQMIDAADYNNPFPGAVLIINQSVTIDGAGVRKFSCIFVSSITITAR